MRKMVSVIYPGLTVEATEWRCKGNTYTRILTLRGLDHEGRIVDLAFNDQSVGGGSMSHLDTLHNQIQWLVQEDKDA